MEDHGKEHDKGQCGCGCHNCDCNKGGMMEGGEHMHMSREMLEQKKEHLEKKMAWVNEMLAKPDSGEKSDDKEDKE